MNQGAIRMAGIRSSLTSLAILLAMGLTDAFAQHVPSRERVDANLRRRTEIDGNNVRTSVFNFVFSGRTGSGQGVPYEWPKNTGRYYVALVALFAGAEVLDEDSARRIIIVDIPAFRQQQGTGKDWNMGPVPGYFNTSRPGGGKIAKSDEPDTWPAFWPDKLSDPVDPGWRGSWNGFFGKNQFNADQELFARVGDDNYDKFNGVNSPFNYHPDTTDLSRRGLGLIIDQRVLAWSQASVADAVYFIHEVKNDGTKDLAKAAVTLWVADFVGGDGDSQDDSPDFDLLLDVAFSLDSDGISSNPAFQGVCVGCAATLYLETPGNAVDRIDNDGDSPEFATGPKVTGALFEQRIPGTTREIPGNQIDDNLNGLIDEDSTYIPFAGQRGVGYADGIDNNDDGEPGSPVITQTMINQAATDPWRRWPPNPETDPFQQGAIHLIDVGSEDLGKRFKDNIDNDGDAEGGPLVTQEMINQASSDPFRRYRVPGTRIILYDLGSEDLGKKYISRNGLRDAFIDEGIDEMIDESRNDGIDNDGDWNILTDDVGLDGAPNTGDPGEGDGKPTSGVGTPFPGEPNIDKTDVSEADQVGLTNVQYRAAGAINFSTTADGFFWNNFMLPGSFIIPGTIPTGEYDLFVSSGVFPLDAGQIERISYAVVFGNASRCPGNADFTGAKADALRKREFALLAYNEDYQFAQAPLEPTVVAVSGDRKVTLYWDDVAERSFDRFLAGIPGAPAEDFEGYKIFRATDPAFEDARVITDMFGNPAPWLKPVASFDKKNGIRGPHPTPFNGVQYDLGDDTGLRHSWTDTSVQNGQKYYYAVRAYDQGYAPLNITPAESNLRVNIDNVTGEVTGIGKSVAIVVPEAPVAGYVPPKVSEITLVRGSTTGTIEYMIVDPREIRDNHRYRITFEDTVRVGAPGLPDTFLTKSYTLADITMSTTSPDTLISKRRTVSDTLEQPLVHGFRLILRNEKLFGVNPSRSGYNNTGIMRFDFRQWKGGFVIGQQRPDDYKVIFGPVGTDTSVSYRVSTQYPPVPAKPVNFKVLNTTQERKIDVAFAEFDLAGGPGIFSANRDIFGQVRSDFIIFLERDANDSLVTTWGFSALYDSSLRLPTTGDTATIVLAKLFRSGDVFEFTTTAQRVDRELAKSSLDKIRVVPNPYVAAATWEERNPFTTGRGPRSLHFIHLPQQCTIRIFTVSGELVATIQHDSNVLDGTAQWNLLTRDNLAVSYGIYIYHVEAPGIGEKVGKFAVIK